MVELNLIKKKYGKDFKNHLLEQYKLYVETSLDISSKRLETNKFYLALNSAVFGLTGYLTTLNNNLVIFLFSIIGILISIVWYLNIFSYKELNSAKFKVIHELEKHLPASLFKSEEECYLNKYHNLTSIEKFVPAIFGILYFVIIAITLFSWFSNTPLIKINVLEIIRNITKL